MARIAWHPAFVQAITHELEDYLDVLTFESEYQLTTEPLKIDVLIIKKKKDVEIKKNIAQIFRQFNVVEYKSPKDRVSVENYHKTQCYARLYAALNKVSINDMSVTVVATRHPRKLMTFLKHQYTVQYVQQGIYMVGGDTCPTQIVVSEELSEDNNLWLNSLRNDLTVEQFDRVDQSNEQKLPMDAYFHVIGEANIEALEELYMRRKKGVILSEKLDAYFGEKYGPRYFAEGEARGVVRGIAIGEARGMAMGTAEGGRNTVLTVLRARFQKVPQSVEKAIRSLSDPIALESWAVQAATCQSIKEFAEAIK